MDSSSFTPKNHAINHSNEHSASLSLAPNEFFLKRMNISREALNNIFIFWKDAISNFLNGNYIAHDSLVGENACHIRACALVDLAMMRDTNELFHSTLVSIITELTHIINTIKIIDIHNADSDDSVQAFLEKNNLIFSIPSQLVHHIQYIIDSYLLTLTKESLPTSGLTLRERTSYQPVREWGFAYNRAQYLVHNTQKTLSSLSCNHVISEAKELKNKYISALLQIKKDAHGRSFIPQFFTAKVLFLRVLEQNRRLIVKITRYYNGTPFDTSTSWFKPNESRTDFELSPTPSENSSCYDIPCIVTAAVINYQKLPESMKEYKERLLSHSVLDTLLANFAIHPQYSGELKHLPPPFEEVISLLEQDSTTTDDSFTLHNTINSILAEKKEFEKYKNFAIEKGCSLDNPSLLFINHMYCDTTANYLYDSDNRTIVPNNLLNDYNSWPENSQELTA